MNLNQDITFSVTQEDIDASIIMREIMLERYGTIYNLSKTCPVALCMQRTLHDQTLGVGISEAHIYGAREFGGQEVITHRIALPEYVGEFIKSFDRDNNTMVPFSFISQVKEEKNEPRK